MSFNGRYKNEYSFEFIRGYNYGWCFRMSILLGSYAVIILRAALKSEYPFE